MAATVFSCPECGATLKLAQTVAPGKKIKCPKCAAIVTVPGRQDEGIQEPVRRGPKPARTPAPDLADEEDDDYRPRGKRPKEEKSSRGLMLGLILGGAAFVLIGVGVVLVLVLSGGGGGGGSAGQTQDLIVGKWESPHRPVPIKFTFTRDGDLTQDFGFKSWTRKYKVIDNSTVEIGPPDFAKNIPGAKDASEKVAVAVTQNELTWTDKGGEVIKFKRDPKTDGKPKEGDPLELTGLPLQAAMVQSNNNLRQIALAMHNYNDTYKRLPPVVVYDKQGRPLYSWRVLLLPFLEQDHLYKQFKLDEPWDSPNNRRLASTVVPAYASPVSGKTRDPADTFYQVFVNSPANPNQLLAPPFRSDPKLQLSPFKFVPANVFIAGDDATRIPQSFTDGTSNTILVAEAGEAVPWSKPADLVYHPNQPLPRLGGLFARGFHVALADGSARFIERARVSEKTLRNAITANDGEPLGPDW
jgi:hypothetical protein